MSFWKNFKPKSCSCGLKAVDKEPLLEELVDNLVKGGALAEQHRQDALKALRDRELLASTGVGMNVAIPHVKLVGLKKTAAAISIHREGVDWQAVDGEPVHIFFVVLRPEEAGREHDPEEHLEMMRWIARLAREADFRNFALQAKTKTELVDLLKEMANV